ncbi:hypothetical protein L7F22_051821 [Adiantum nelumboides]|nr:hypothetical protein [Adiantum nelumboides]
MMGLIGKICGRIKRTRKRVISKHNILILREGKGYIEGKQIILDIKATRVKMDTRIVQGRASGGCTSRPSGRNSLMPSAAGIFLWSTNQLLTIECAYDDKSAQYRDEPNLLVLTLQQLEFNLLLTVQHMGIETVLFCSFDQPQLGKISTAHARTW